MLVYECVMIMLMLCKSSYARLTPEVLHLTTIRVLLSLAASHGLLVHQMDVKIAFLNGELEVDIYMDQPDGFVATAFLGYLRAIFEHAMH